MCDKDGRSMKLIFVAHCLLNQNARDRAAVEFPDMMKPVLETLVAREIGIIQLPCPELMVPGRTRPSISRSQVRLGRLIADVIYQIKEYQAAGFEGIGILGKSGSPTCGVEKISPSSGFGPPGEGVFIKLLRQRLKAERLEIAVRGIDDHNQQEAVDWVFSRTC
jgi:predicted secreted protein